MRRGTRSLLNIGTGKCVVKPVYGARSYYVSSMNQYKEDVYFENHLRLMKRTRNPDLEIDANMGTPEEGTTYAEWVKEYPTVDEEIDAGSEDRYPDADLQEMMFKLWDECDHNGRTDYPLWPVPPGKEYNFEDLDRPELTSGNNNTNQKQ
eukprot:TRINITY_DN18124_c0_g1_i1.p1 TRINITY_DN18124_c0_g1~~TRINITY_DN18124_c0_g1_i1.p1  ORF type:complete len:150 (+),score=38.90 TRINITY_DN18124_c0_g1_i1:20-469(+)